MMKYRPFFPNSLFYPCSAFDGYFMRLVNSQPDKFKTANFVHVDIGDYSIIYPGDIEKTSDLFAKFKSKLDKIPYYNFESTPVGIEQITNKDLPLVSFYDNQLLEVRQKIQYLESEIRRIKESEEIKKDDFIFSEADGLEFFLLPEVEEKKENQINDRFLYALYRGSKKAIFKGEQGHNTIYVMFVLSDAFEFYEKIYFEQRVIPTIFAEKYGKVDFRTEITQGNLSSKWIISDKLNPGDVINGYQNEGTTLYPHRTLHPEHSLEIFKRK